MLRVNAGKGKDFSKGDGDGGGDGEDLCEYEDLGADESEGEIEIVVGHEVGDRDETMMKMNVGVRAKVMLGVRMRMRMISLMKTIVSEMSSFPKCLYKYT